MATSKELRPYQARIVENVGQSNAILKMPTGSGKTIVAAELIRRSLESYPSYRILFLVPTCELVSQQSNVIRNWVSTAVVAGFTGGMADPEVSDFHVLVATPAAYLSLKVRKEYPWGWYRLVVFDEVHHVLKEHPYRTIALALKDHCCSEKNAPVQILGLSASLTYQIADEAIQKTLERLCYELDIVKMESPTPQELKDGGLEVWYVALRVLVTTWEEDEQVVLQWLQMNDALTESTYDSDDLLELIANLRQRASNQYIYFKWNRLKHHLEEKKRRFGDHVRCIVFVQQRITSYVLAKMINDHHFALGLCAGFVSSRGSKITPSIKVSKSMVAESIQKFRDGQLNVLVATSVVEEGIDIPEANVVILYDSMKDSVELCQRFGRARAHQSSIVILDERNDRPVVLLESVRNIQDTLVNEFDPVTIGINVAEERLRQKGREQGGYRSVLCHEKCVKTPILALNEYKVKTKAYLTEQWSNCDCHFRCNMEYKSILRTLNATGEGATKQGAKILCADNLLRELKRVTAGMAQSGLN
ncbi:hypothetical protein MPSEU_000393600 [Mayamaea pseudoterrestris]|nr:hypothetical protein MPSEU_000393600 [Mayamaea pseudoterrestris]